VRDLDSHNFEDLPRAAPRQRQPRRLLLVFAGARRR